MSRLNASRGVKILGAMAAILIALCPPVEAAGPSAAEKQVFEKAMADRMAFEKEKAQQQLARSEEDERRKILRQREEEAERQRLSQAPPPSPPPNPSQAIAHQGGASFASSLQGGVINAAKSPSPHIVPRFQTEKPPESSLTAGSIGDAALAASRVDEASQSLASSAKDRPRFKFNPDADPLFVDAKQAIKNPHQSLNEEIMEISASGSAPEEIKTCEEGGDEYGQSCSKRLEVVLKITPATTTTVSYCDGHKARRRLHYRHWTCGGCKSRQVAVPKKVEVESEQWVDGCAVLEDLVEQGFCRYVGASRSPKNETRAIQGEPVTRDHFEEHYQFACFKASSNRCEKLREQGCYQVKSICKETIGGNCVLWEQTYACPSGNVPGKSYRSSNTHNPFCLTGDCADTSYPANTELLSVMSHLYVLREAQNDLRNHAIIFKGQHRWCTRNFMDFRDCCGSGRGWGVTLHLSSCDAAEIELRTLRDKRLCVQVGTYCAEKALGVCIRKKTSFCCYGSKIARLIQEHGRAQLGMSFGTPESPDCNGLSAEHLSRMDFARINFSELFEDIRSHTVVKGQEQSLAQMSVDRLRDNMSLLTNPSHPKQGDPPDTKPPHTEHPSAEPFDGQSASTLQQLKGKGF